MRNAIQAEACGTCPLSGACDSNPLVHNGHETCEDALKDALSRVLMTMGPAVLAWWDLAIGADGDEDGDEEGNAPS